MIEIYHLNDSNLLILKLIKITANLWNKISSLISTDKLVHVNIYQKKWAGLRVGQSSFLKGQRLLTLKPCSKYISYGIKWKEIKFQTWKVTFMYFHVPKIYFS